MEFKKRGFVWGISFLAMFFIILSYAGFVFAAPTCELLSRTPSNINDSSTGYFNVLINCSDPTGINLTKTGNSYRAFVTRTVDNFIISSGPPNYAYVFYPNNSLGNIGTLNPPFKIWRALGRNEGYWYDGLVYYETINNDTFSYGINDGRYGGLTIINESATSTIVNYTGLVEIEAFRTNYYLGIGSARRELKKDFTLTNNIIALAKRFDAEAYRNVKNYTLNVFLNVNNSGTTSRNLLIYYCNESYSPTGGITMINSPNCALVQSLTSSQVKNVFYIDRNSSYIKFTQGVINGMFGAIKTTKEYYLGFDTSASIPQVNDRYKLRYMNGTTQTDIPFNETKTAWTSINDGVTWTQSPWTFDIFSTSARKENEEFQFGLYIENNNGDAYFNASIFSDQIGPTNHPISNPIILIYNSSSSLEDYERSGVHSKMMNIYIGAAIDPDSVGNVTHNLTLRNIDESFNYTINGSFKITYNSHIWIDFNTSLVPDGVYKMNVTAIAGDNLNDIKSFSTSNNFTILNAEPTYNLTFISISSNNSFNTSFANLGDLVTISFNSSGPLTNPSINIYSDGNLTWDNPVIANTSNFYNVSHIVNSSDYEGTIYFEIHADNLNLFYSSTTDNSLVILDKTTPQIDYGTGTEDNETNFSRNWIYVDVSLEETNFQNITFYLYNSTHSLNQSNTFSDLTINYNFTNLDSGTYYYNATVYDKAGNRNSTATRKITIDDVAPIISISYPINETSYSFNITSINYSVSDNIIGLSSCWYSNDSGVNNYSLTCGENISVNLGEGDYTYVISSNDSLNNRGSESVFFTISTMAPAITLNSPENGYWFNSFLNIEFNFTATDSGGISSCELWGNWTGEWHKNQTLTDVVNSTLTSFNLLNLTEGSYIWNVWCNDTSDNKHFYTMNHTINIDSTFPQIDYSTGTEETETNFSRNWIYVNLSFTEINFANITFTLINDTDIINSTTFLTQTYSINWTNLLDNNYTYFANITDNANNQNSTIIRKLSLDTTSPALEIISPTATNYTSATQLLNISATDSHLSTIWYNWNGVNTTYTSATNIVFSEGYNTLFVWANDSLGNLNSTNVSFTINTPASVEETNTTTSGGGYAPQTYYVDEKLSTQGNNFNLRYNDKVKFVVRSINHTLTMQNFNSTSAKVKIQSSPIIIWIEKNILYEFDLNNDSIKDVRVRYDGMNNTKAKVFIQEIVYDSGDLITGDTVDTSPNESEGGLIEYNPYLVLIIVIILIIGIILSFIFYKRHRKS